MDNQEKRFNSLDCNIKDMKLSLQITERRIADMIDQTLTAMRIRDKQRHAEILSSKLEAEAYDNQRRLIMKEIKNLIIERRRWIIAMVVVAVLSIISLALSG